MRCFIAVCHCTISVYTTIQSAAGTFGILSASLEVEDAQGVYSMLIPISGSLATLHPGSDNQKAGARRRNVT
jgi:hypothetical protein